MTDDDARIIFAGLRPAPRRVRIAWFDEVLEAMAAAPTRYTGVVRARVEDNGGTEFTYRVVRDGRRVRCSALDGSIHVIAGTSTIWCRRNGRDGPEIEPEPMHPRLLYTPDDYEFGVRGFDWHQWDGDDFTEPIRGPDEVTILGRRAWRITLAPPPHKPEPMQIVVDQQTFLTLYEGNEAFGTYHEWIELDLNPEIDQTVFTWNETDRVATDYQ